jgi:hypothetical protein
MSDEALSFVRTMLRHTTPENVEQPTTSQFSDVLLQRDIGIHRAMKGTLSEEDGLALANAASGDPKSWDLAKSLIIARLSEGKPLPAALSIIASIMLSGSDPKGKRGRPRWTVRDRIIVSLIAILQERDQIQPTRNATTDTLCGVSIVTTCLNERGFNLTEAAVEKVWASRLK